MNGNRARSAFTITTALVLSLPASAIAQVTGGGQASSPDQLTEIVVTARRVEERLQQVPISISVFTQQQLTDRNITSAVDLATYTPSLGVDNGFGQDNATFMLRGFRQDSGTSATVAVYFDDVVAPRGGIGGALEHAGDGAGPGSFFDLQNVQVLKGPQGTLFGRNTTGGALLLVPQKPTPDFEGYLEVSGGNYDMERAQGVINLPIDDRIRLRLGIDQETREGYLKNVSGIGPDDFNNIDYFAARASLVVDVTDDIENYTVGSFSRSDNNGPAQQMFTCNRNAPLSVQLFAQMSCNQLARFNGNPDYNVENEMPTAGSYIRQWQIVNTTTWSATDNLTAKNIASYAEYAGSLANPLFGSDWIIPPVLTLEGKAVGGTLHIPTGQEAGQHLMFTASNPAPGHYLSDQLTFTEELQFQGQALDDKLRWTAGLYMEGSHPLAPSGPQSPVLLDCSSIADLQCTDVLQSILHIPFGEVQRQVGGVTFRDYAAYAQGIYSIFDNLKLTAGLRVTDDSTTGQVTRVLWAFPEPNQPHQECLGGVVDKVNCFTPLHTSSRAPTWLLGLDYTPVEDLLTYVKYARGYRTGGIVLAAPPGYLQFQPETVDNYELGAKYSLHGPVPGFIDVAAFYNDFSNQQIPIGFIVPPGSGLGAPSGSVENLGKSRIYGLELETTLKPYEGVTLDLSYTYLNTKIEQITQPIQIPGSPFVPTVGYTAGSPLIYTPHNKLSFTASYRLPVDESLGNITVAATYTYTGSTLTGITGPYQTLPAYDLLNLNVNWESIYGSPIDAEFFMTNVADNFYATNISDYTNILGFAARTLGEPRMFGGRLRYHFGGASEPASAAEAPYTPPPVQTPAPAIARNYMVFFDFDKSDLTPEAVSIVDQAARNAGPAKATTLTVTGHTDTVGSDAYNMRLSKRRADSVAAELEKNGIPSSEIAIVAKGKHDLLVPTKDGVREPQNRRVTIVYDGGPTS